MAQDHTGQRHPGEHRPALPRPLDQGAPAGNAELGWFTEFAGPADALTTSLFQTFDPTQVKTAPKTVDGVPSVGIDDGQQILWVDVATARPVRLAQHASPAQPAADQVAPVTNTFSD